MILDLDTDAVRILGSCQLVFIPETVQWPTGIAS